MAIGIFRQLAVANGGAAVASLAFTGNVAGRGIAVSGRRRPRFSMVLRYPTKIGLFQETPGTVEKQGAQWY
jgi:hypothetical protein